ncbi:redoxin domain-containing protein [Ensifer sp. HO-A22]|uniref:Redoxin domain-containing protein n=1 Tax=Ensifer oleiphilus TaxID=2742698 RepID=A0A7Y6UMV6_9HYPH|nr:redoxin domain-containing protein [Ensifer oleiphilus]NVD38928.1 redoxin domain-containing protein [Ensifer oleiphilus]
MEDDFPALRPGEAAPAFSLDAANAEGAVSLADLRGRPFLIGLFRGLHCPFCRRQLRQFSALQPALSEAGVETLAVINTPVERARLYLRFQPTPVTVLCDPECRTHHDFGVPLAGFAPADSTQKPQWPLHTSVEQFAAARINPGGELAEPAQPMKANDLLNAIDGFELHDIDRSISEKYGTQLVGHFLVDRSGCIAWAEMEARDGPEGLGTFPTAERIIAAAREVAASAAK